MWPENKTNDVIGLGNTIMDFLIEIEDYHLANLNLNKGEFHLTDNEQAKQLLEKIKQQNYSIKSVPGGSSANTLKGIAFLGGKAILCGKVGEDQHGYNYINEMNQLGVITRINSNSSSTGHALTFITPDAERTFSVHLGAAVELDKKDILEEDIKKSKILHLEGYQIEGSTKKTILHAIELAKKNNTLISIDLADPGVVRRNKKFLEELIKNHIDIVFVNEIEAQEFTNLQEEEAAIELAKQVKIAIVKIGKKGSLICQKGDITKIKSYPANAIDTTGAGDSYAAGFLYGYCNHWSLQKSGQLGSLLASKVVEQIGVSMKNLNSKKLISFLNSQ